jgi:hypothetical protein
MTAAMPAPTGGGEAVTYQRLRAHLDVLRLSAAAESLTMVLDSAREQDLSVITAMERLFAIEVAAVQARRHARAAAVRLAARAPCDRGFRLLRPARRG